MKKRKHKYEFTTGHPDGPRKFLRAKILLKQDTQRYFSNVKPLGGGPQWCVWGTLSPLFWWTFLSNLWMRPWMTSWYICSKNEVDKHPNNWLINFPLLQLVPHFFSHYQFLSPYILFPFPSYINIPNIILHPWLRFPNNIHVSDLWKLLFQPSHQNYPC